MDNVKIVYNKMSYLYDDRLTLKAKGFMSLCIAYINSQNSKVKTFRLQDLAPYYRESATAVKSAMAELVDRGYVERSMDRLSNKRGVSWEFTFYE